MTTGVTSVEETSGVDELNPEQAATKTGLERSILRYAQTCSAETDELILNATVDRTRRTADGLVVDATLDTLHGDGMRRALRKVRWYFSRNQTAA